MKSPIQYFSSITDPRVERTIDHLMSDIIFITIAAVICGCETWNEIELYGKTKEPWLRTFLSLLNGIPSDDTFNRFYSAVEPQQLEGSFISWVKDESKITDGEICLVLK